MKSLEEADRVLLKALDAALTQDLGVLKSMGASEAELEAFAREQRLAYAEARFAVNSELLAWCLTGLPLSGPTLRRQ